MQADDSAVPSLLIALLGRAACLSLARGTKMVLQAKASSPACLLHIRAGAWAMGDGGSQASRSLPRCNQRHGTTASSIAAAEACRMLLLRCKV